MEEQIISLHPTSRPTLRLLIVDDNHDDAALLSAHLQSGGYPTETCEIASREEFLGSLHQPWDLILCDYNLPGFSPYQALELLHQQRNPTPLIVISGEIDSTEAAELMLKGARDFIDKNDLARLLPAIAREQQVSRLRMEKRRIEDKLSNLAWFDELTALPNRNHFIDRLQAIIERQDNSRFVVGYVNFERLSMIHDIYGQATGHQILRQLADRLYQVSHHACVARLDQNDFSLLLSCDGDCRRCDSTANEIQQQFEQPFKIDNHEVFITPTLGMSCYPCQDNSPDKLLRNARYAMQHAQEKQRPFQHFYPQIEQEKIDRILISDRLRGAVTRQDLSLNYQPKLAANSQQITAMEVLLRWHDEQLGNVSPARFIPIAEDTGDIMAIGEWVLRRACEQGVEWQHSRQFHGKLAVNLSMRQLRDPHFALLVERILHETGFPAERLELEITETDIMKDSELSIITLNQLNKLGIDLVIDDFGTGYSSLSYLKKLPICALKIDRAFITDIENSADSLAIVQAILALARSLKLHTVAEGVENAAQARLLEQEGCNELQGYHISRPQAAAQIIELVRQWTPRSAHQVKLAKQR